ncbi:MAG: hypothetical protein IVW57_11040, partial [Ktedonobacterales bacterium]|nr:hypothetical protein [Ktedonobacterales bacterium]
AWLLEREGYSLDQPTESEQMVIWRGRSEDASAVACAVRLPMGWLLDSEEVQRIAATAAGSPPAHAVLLTTASATLGAMRTAERLGVRLIARPALTALLARLATAHERERSQAWGHSQERADAASAARKTLLAAVKAMETALGKPGKTLAVGERAAVVAAASEVAVAARDALRALVAWETLVSDWLAAFGERAERDGTLQFTAEAGEFTALSERGIHLRDVAVKALRQLARTPTDGDLGYGTWRQAVAEEVGLRCESLRWRIQIISPAHWQDFAAARHLDAEANATRATTAAARAAARAAQAYDQFATRAGLAKFPSV